jgi:hypothetical protein
LVVLNIVGDESSAPAELDIRNPELCEFTCSGQNPHPIEPVAAGQDVGLGSCAATGDGITSETGPVGCGEYRIILDAIGAVADR